MANGNSSTVNTVTPVESKQPEKSNLTEIKVTVEEGKEIAQILYVQTSKILALAFSLQDSYENESQYNRDALHDASMMFLKAQCARVIAQWDNMVTRNTKLQKYADMPRNKVENALKIHPKYKGFYESATKAKLIKEKL